MKTPIQVKFAPEFWQTAPLDKMAAAEGMTKDQLIQKFQTAAALVNAEQHDTHQSAMESFRRHLGGEGDADMRPLTPEENRRLEAVMAAVHDKEGGDS